MLPNYWSQMLWTISNKLQVNILTSFSKENFHKNIRGMKLEFKKDRWKIKFKQNNMEKLTSNMKPPHCHT
jgi:hypothetical protein